VTIIIFVFMEIISARLFRSAPILAVTCCVSFGSISAAELVLQKVPALTVEQAPAYPENLARYHFGAQVEAAPESNPISGLKLSSKSEDRNTAEAALLCDDPTVGYALSNGNKTLLISLSKIENIESISFLNHGVKGDVTIATSNAKLPADSPQWHVVSHQKLTADAVKAKVGPSEAKYVKLIFNVTEPGRIAALGVYSKPTIAAFTMPRARKLDLDQSDSLALISYNLTDLHAKARALYVSSGDDLRRANNMIDDQPSSTYNFGSADATPTAVIDLGKVTTLRRISALYSSRQGTVDFFVLESLPGSRQGNVPKTLTLDNAALAGLKSVGSVKDDGTGRAAIDFPETSGRYIMVKWTPATQQDNAFSVAEVAAFGGSKRGNLIAAHTGGTREGIASDGKTVQEGKDLGDGKEMPEEGPEAPGEGPVPPLPDPPPFTFVPEIVPASP
jgi:hypothetical protein